MAVPLPLLECLSYSSVAFFALEAPIVALYGAIFFVYFLTMVLLSNSLQRVNSSYQSSTVNHTEIILNKLYSQTGVSWY